MAQAGGCRKDEAATPGLAAVRRVALSWSSGKDSAWALHLLRQDPQVEVIALITSINGEANRVAMHAVRRALVIEQAAQLGLPLWTVELPWPCSNDNYERLMSGVCTQAIHAGVEAIGFGDLFLRDIRDYRERQLAGTGLQPIFPVWNLPTAELARQMIAWGLKAKITCVDPKRLDRSFAGQDFTDDMPAGIDPCGENGEFHTFVYDCPLFKNKLAIALGEIVERDGFVFADVLPASEVAATAE